MANIMGYTSQVWRYFGRKIVLVLLFSKIEKYLAPLFKPQNFLNPFQISKMSMPLLFNFEKYL